MLEPDSKQRDIAAKGRRNPRPINLIPDLDVPPLIPRWFHAIDNPIIDPVSVRRAKSNPTLHKSSSSPKLYNKTISNASKWIPFSKRDSIALEKAYQNHDVRAKVPVNEDHLFEVDVTERTISPVYWEGPTYEVRRATWFMQSDGWIPCEESLAEQLELGYYKHKPYVDNNSTASTTITPATSLAASDDVPTATATDQEQKKLEEISKQPSDKHWNLLGPYLGQYIVYTGKDTAYLLSNSTSSKFAKSIITRFTSKQNVGGTKLLRGYPAVEEHMSKRSSAKSTKKKSNQHQRSSSASSSSLPNTPVTEDLTTNSNGASSVLTMQTQVMTSASSSDDDSEAARTQHLKSDEKQRLEENEVEDYDNEHSEEEIRKIDHLMFVIHGIGQKMTERTGQTFVHDVNTMRKTIKTVYNTAISTTSTPNKPNGIQVLPIMWRQDIKFGMAADDEEEGMEADLGTVGMEDGCPTLDELTLDGVPNLRTVVSDVLMDVPLYMTPRYRELMTRVISNEINRVYKLFIDRNPEFLEKGKVSIFGHSLGSLLAFDMLSLQPLHLPSSPSSSALNEKINRVNTEKHMRPSRKTSPPPLQFKIENFFAAGSPLGVILLLRGFKINSRKALDLSTTTNEDFLADVHSPSPTSINYCYPAVNNLYNIFHKSDPVAYRLEPLVARHYTAKLKPEPIPYMKGGLKGVLDASFNVGSGIANRAGAMYESLKMGLTANLFMRGLGLSRQQIYEDMHPDKATTTTTTTAEEEYHNELELYDDIEDGESATAISTEVAAIAANDILASSNDNAGLGDAGQHQIHKLTRVRSNSDPFSNVRSSNDTAKGSTLQKKKSSGNILRSRSPTAPRTVASLGVASSIAASTTTTATTTIPHTATALKGAERLRMLNFTGRVDYCLQEGILENPYLNAFSAHMQYWQDLDVAAFLVKQIYSQDNLES